MTDLRIPVNEHDNVLVHVLRRIYPNDMDYWDGNWLVMEVERVGWMSSRKSRPEQPTGRDEVSRIANGSGSASASCGCTCIIQEPRANLGDGCERTRLGLICRW